MKSLFFAAAFAAATLAVSAASTNDVLEAESDIEMPKIEASVNYRTSKIEYGMVENDESVFGYEVEIEWYGLFGGFEACHDLTDVNERRGRFNEIESFLGYGFRLGDFSAKAAYVYKSVFDDEESDTQQVELELEYETPWVESEIHSARVHRGADGTVCAEGTVVAGGAELLSEMAGGCS